MENTQHENQNLRVEIATIMTSVKYIRESLDNINKSLADLSDRTDGKYDALAKRVSTNELNIVGLKSVKHDLKEQDKKIDCINIKIAKWGGVIAVLATIANIAIDKIWK